MLKRIATWWRDRRREPETKALTYEQIAVLARPDGFIPSVQFDSSSDLDLLYRASSLAFACMNANASAMASLPLTVQRRGEEGEALWVDDPKHELGRWIDTPTGENTSARWSMSHLVKAVALHLYIDGNAYLRPFLTTKRDTLVRVELWSPTETEVVKDARGRAAVYRGKPIGAAQSEEAGWRDIVHLQEVAPGSQIDGISHLGAVLDAVGADSTAIERIKSNLSNRIAPGLIFTIQSAFGVGTPQRDAFLAELRENFQQATDDGRPLILGADAKVVAAPSTTHQIDFRAIRDLNRGEIVAVFGTPPPLIGDYEQATLQNFDASFRVWWLSRLLPMLGSICDGINRQLVWPIYGRGVRLWYDLAQTEIGLLLLEQKAKVAQDLVNLGFPANDANARVGLGMPRHDELDAPLQNLAQAGRIDPETEADNVLDTDPR